MADLLITSTEASTVDGASTATVGSDLTASLDVLRDSLFDVDSEANVASGSQASLVGPLTATLNVSVQSVSSTELIGNVVSGSQASLVGPLTATLDVSVQSVSSIELIANVVSGSQPSLVGPLTATLDVSVQSVTSIEGTTNVVSGSQASLASPKTVDLEINVSLLGLASTEDSSVDGTATATVGSDLTSSLDVSVASLLSVNGIANVASGSQASLAVPVTTSLDVSVQSVTSVEEIANVVSGSQPSLADPKTAGLQVNVSILGFESTTDSEVAGLANVTIGSDLTCSLDVLRDSLFDVDSVANVISGSQASLAAPVTTSLDVSVQSVTSVEEIANVVSGSQASLAAPLTASLDVSKDSLNSTTLISNVVSGSQPSLADPLTASVDVSVQSVTSVEETTNVVSGSQASLAAPKTAALSVNVSILGFESTTDSFVEGTVGLAVAKLLTATEASQVTGSGNLLKSLFVTSDLDQAVAETFTVTTSCSVTVKGTETRSADLDVLSAQFEAVTASLDVTIFGTSTQSTNLQVLKQGDVEHTATLNMYLGAEQFLTASLDQLVKAIQFRYATIDVHPSPTRAFLVPLDALVQGVFTRSASLSLIVQSTEEKSATLDMIIEARRPYSLCKLWGHLRTRFFGGTASDANFFEHFEPHPAAVINQDLGSITPGDREVTFQVPNTIPTPASYDKYSLPFSAPLPVSTVGYRLLVCFELRSFGPNNTLLLGAFTGTNDPITDLANGDFVGMAIEAEKGHVEFRAWAGGNESSRSFGLGLPTDRFVNVPLLLEIETVAATAGLTDMEFRLFDRAFNLDRPLALIELQTSVPPDTTHFAITSLGRRTVELPTAQQDMHVDLRYVDIEPGTGTLYTPEFVAPADAKLRAFHDRPPLVLSNQGTLLLGDTLAADAGYWRLSTEVATTLTFPGVSAQLSGVIYGEPVGAASWRDYEVSAEFRPVSSGTGTDVVGIGLYGAGDFLTGDSLVFAVTYTNDFTVVRTVGGVQTVLVLDTYTADTLEPTRWHRLRFSARTDVDGTTLVHAFIDEHEVYQGTTDSLTGGAPMLLNFTAVDVQFRDLQARQGVNDVFMVLSDSPSSLLFTQTQFDTLTVDSSDPVITVVTFTTDSPVLVPGSVNPPIVKGSLNPGFSGVAMSWYATHAGTWTLRVNSTGAGNGIELRSGTYPTAFETVSTGWDFSELPQVDDVYDVTLYLIAESGKPTAKRLGEYLLP